MSLRNYTLLEERKPARFAETAKHAAPGSRYRHSTPLQHCAMSSSRVIFMFKTTLEELALVYVIMRSLAVALMLLVVSAVAQPQQQPMTCSTRLTMYLYDQNAGLIMAPGMTTDQAKWFDKKGKKKYREFCFDPGKASYVMVTIRWTEDKRQTTEKTKSAYTTGPVNVVSGLSSSAPGQPAVPIWRTQLGTFVTTWQEKQTEIIPERHALILVFETKDTLPLSATSELRSDPVFKAKGVGKDAAGNALQFVLEHWDLKLSSKVQ